MRLTLWYITSIAALVIILGTVVYVSLRVLLLRKLDEALAHGAIVLTQSLLDYGLTDKDNPLSLFDGEDLFTDEIDEEASDIGIAFAQLRLVGAGDEPAITFVARTSTLKEEPLPLSPSAYQTIRSGSHLIESVKAESAGPLRMLSLLAHDKDSRPYVLQLALSLQETRANLDSLLIGFAVSLPVLILSLSILSHVFMNRAFQPVRTMVTVAKSITAEDLSRRLDHVDSRDEIGELAGTLNGMIARLESSFNHVQQFSADVAHELKTPLARLRCNAEVALRHKRTGGEYREALKDLVEDAQRLQRIVEDLLLLARIDSQDLSLPVVPIPLHEVVLEVLDRESTSAGEKRLVVSLQDIQQVMVRGDRSMLEMLFTNLIKNAVQYTHEGGELSLALKILDGKAEFTLADTGVGILKENLPRVFDRFYRVDPSRSPETGGSGLGLAIVKGIVKAHGGEVHVQSVEGKGTTFRVIFPVCGFH